MIASDHLRGICASKIVATYDKFGIELDDATQQARKVKENTPKFAKNLDNLIRELTQEAYNAAADLDLERAEAAGQRLASLVAVKERADFRHVEVTAENTHQIAVLDHFRATGRNQLGEHFNKAAAKFTDALSNLGGPALTRFKEAIGNPELAKEVSILLEQASIMNFIATAVDSAADQGIKAHLADLNGGIVPKAQKVIETTSRYMIGYATGRDWENGQGPHTEDDPHLAPAARWIHMLHDNHPQPGAELLLQMRPIAEQQAEAQLIADVWNYSINKTYEPSGEGNKLRAWKKAKSEISDFKKQVQENAKYMQKLYSPVR